MKQKFKQATQTLLKLAPEGFSKCISQLDELYQQHKFEEVEAVIEAIEKDDGPHSSTHRAEVAKTKIGSLLLDKRYKETRIEDVVKDDPEILYHLIRKGNSDALVKIAKSSYLENNAAAVSALIARKNELANYEVLEKDSFPEDLTGEDFEGLFPESDNRIADQYYEVMASSSHLHKSGEAIDSLIKYASKSKEDPDIIFENLLNNETALKQNPDKILTLAKAVLGQRSQLERMNHYELDMSLESKMRHQRVFDSLIPKIAASPLLAHSADTIDLLGAYTGPAYQSGLANHHKALLSNVEAFQAHEEKILPFIQQMAQDKDKNAIHQIYGAPILALSKASIDFLHENHPEKYYALAFNKKALEAFPEEIYGVYRESPSFPYDEPLPRSQPKDRILASGVVIHSSETIDFVIEQAENYRVSLMLSNAEVANALTSRQLNSLIDNGCAEMLKQVSGMQGYEALTHKMDEITRESRESIAELGFDMV